jgi:hypothetical protein
MMWLGILVSVICGLVLIVAGAVSVRPASTAGGLLLAAAGALELLALCCVRGANLAGPEVGGGDDALRLLQASWAAASCLDLVVVGLVTAAFVVTSKKLRASGPPG